MVAVCPGECAFEQLIHSQPHLALLTEFAQTLCKLDPTLLVRGERLASMSRLYNPTIERAILTPWQPPLHPKAPCMHLILHS